MCHPIEDGTFEAHFAKLVFNGARLQPFSEDSLEAEYGRFGQTPAVIATVAFPHFSPQVPDLA